MVSYNSLEFGTFAIVSNLDFWHIRISLESQYSRFLPKNSRILRIFVILDNSRLMRIEKFPYFTFETIAKTLNSRQLRKYQIRDYWCFPVNCLSIFRNLAEFFCQLHRDKNFFVKIFQLNDQIFQQHDHVRAKSTEIPVTFNEYFFPKANLLI